MATKRTTKPLSHAQNRSRGTWIFGFLLLAFLVSAFAFAPEVLPDFKHRLLGFTCASLAGFFGYFFTGELGLKVKSIRSRFGDIGVKATGGIAAFVSVLIWWSTPLSPVAKEGAIYRLRVTVLGLDQMPIRDADVWSSIGGEPKKVEGGWQFDIPAASSPADGKLTIYAAKKAAFLSGKLDFRLGEDLNPSAHVQLAKDNSALVRGIVLDESNRALQGARVSVVGYEGEAVTQSDGTFVLPAHAANGQQVRLHVEKEGYAPTEEYHAAGDEPATLILERRK